MPRHNRISLIRYIILRRIILYIIVINWLKEQITDALNNTYSFEYDTYGNLTKATDPLGNSAQMVYDIVGRLIQAVDAKEKKTNYSYDSLNRIAEIVDALNGRTKYTYDANRNLLSVTDAKNQTITYTYNSRDKVATMTDQLGKVETYSYDMMNRIKEITDALNGKTKITYDQNGNLLTVNDAKNQTITYTYNVRDKVSSMTDQLGKAEAYAYDKMDNLFSIKDRKSQITSYAYNILNQLTKTTYADGSYMAYTYDAIGRLTYINDSLSGAIEYVYSNGGCAACGGAVDKVIQELTSLGSISYEYDVIGRRISMQVAGQEPVNYSYDSNGRLTDINTLINNVAAGFSLRYDSLGRRTSLNLPNGVTTNYTYDKSSRLLDIEQLNPLNAVLEKISYNYDKNGNRNSMDRLNVAPKLPNAVSNTSYNAANQMLSFNDKSITYDNNGNMTTVTNACGTTNYTWDARNRLVGINGFNTDCSSLTASFKYDALGRRIEKTINGKTINYLYDSLDIIQEIEDGSVTVNYVRTLNIDEPLARIKADGTIRYYQQDALGSVIALTDGTGTIRTQYIYDPFGNTTVIGEASDNPFQYTGRENDGTGLYYYRARYYSPELQRFISEDPVRFRGGINFFAYTDNNPVNYIDPLGLFIRGCKQADGHLCEDPKKIRSWKEKTSIINRIFNPDCGDELECAEYLCKDGTKVTICYCGKKGGPPGGGLKG